MKKIFFCLIYLICLKSLSQNHVDALRYSYLENLGTARLSSVGGSFGSLGADLSSIHVNPAGLAIYRTDEVGFSLNSRINSYESKYFNNSYQSEKTSFYIQNMGYVKTLRDDKSKWNRFSFSLSYNRLKDFNSDFVILGNSNESISYNFLNNSQGSNIEDLNPFSEYLAYSTFLIDTLNQINTYESAISSNSENIFHQNIITRSGYMDELSFSISSAYSDLLFLGLQLGFVGINYNEFNSYKESGFEMNENYEWGNINEFIYNQNLNVIGGGLNYKLGLILKPVQFLRIGAAYHSKTRFEIEENWESNLTTIFTEENMGMISDMSPYGFGNYTLKTPSKTISSIALIIAKRGLINFEFEQIDYSSSKLSADYYNFLEENSNISNFYKKTSNFRLGTEWRFGDINIRAGLGIYESPYTNSNSTEENKERVTQSFGIGYKSNQYFFDFALTHSFEEEEYFMFNNSSPTELSKTVQNLIFTFGYKF